VVSLALEDPDRPRHGLDPPHQRTSIGLIEIARTVLKDYPKRTVLGLSLFIGQAFLYNSILFGYATLLSTFFGVSTADAPYYLVAFAAGNFLGPQLFAPMVATGKASKVFEALAIGAVLMILGGIAELVFGVRAERRRLEGIAKPLTAV
jgi:hypothetical protein